MSKNYLWCVLSLLVFLPAEALACACGCGVFDVGTASMLPTGEGGSVWMEYDYSGQTENWSGNHRAPKDNNDDKRIATNFLTVGGQYMFNRSWGINAQVPYWIRSFKTTDEDSGDIVTNHSRDLGDVRLRGVYSGFSEDMSTGVTFGLKLPTGQWNAAGFDRDTQIGTGSTDLLLGAYHLDNIEDTNFSWFVNGQWERAMSYQDGYRPGNELNAAVGAYYDVGPVMDTGSLSPMVQLIASNRLRDGGPNAATTNSGYTRLLIAPGIEYNINNVKLYADVETPLYENVNGNQLVAPVMFKFIVGYNF